MESVGKIVTQKFLELQIRANYCMHYALHSNIFLWLHLFAWSWLASQAKLLDNTSPAPETFSATPNHLNASLVPFNILKSRRHVFVSPELSNFRSLEKGSLVRLCKLTI
jgi:hypothetical protein